jgi:hypothetical protein
VNAYNAQQQAGAARSAGTMGMLGALGAGAMMAPAGTFSDRRLKKAIKVIGEFMEGIKVYEFEYIWDDIKRIGFMADEVKQVMPEAVITMPNGYDAVNYSMVIYGN